MLSGFGFLLLPTLRVLGMATSALARSTVGSTGPPLVTLDYGAFQGFYSPGSTVSFLGVPFAQPPLGELRFNLPAPPKPFSGAQNATQFGNACPQQPLLGPNETLPSNPGLNGLGPYLAALQPHSTVAASEDCLYLNVVRPVGVSAGDNLPVVVWIFGGAFESGDASGFNGTQIVSRSVDLKSPLIYVSFNHRLNAFGFLGGKEMQAAGLGNIGLHDQRFALEWVKKYISLFGGNPEQVTIWGQSSGSISALLQMIAYDGQLEGLFRGAVMESGSAVPLVGITSPQAQNNFDFLVEKTNCTSANDALDCLRQAPYQVIIDAVLETSPLLSYRSLNTSWPPLVDGVFLKQTIRQSLRQGKYAHVPAILGCVDDEGTVFSLGSLNVTTDEQFLEYLQKIYLGGATESEIYQVGQLYPDNPILGSPYDVGTNDTLSPQYKRIASFQGDFFFQLPRRYTLEHLLQTQNVWSYLWKRDKFIPGIGSFHGSDLQEFYDFTGKSDWVGTDILVNFAYALNPNVPKGGYPPGVVLSLLSNISWSQYTLSSRELLTFEDPSLLTITKDTFRVVPMAFLNDLQAELGL